MQQYDRLAHLTYRLEHNPNCPSAYLVRLPGRGSGVIDGLPYSPSVVTGDRLFFGKTFEAVVDAVLGIPVLLKAAQPHAHYISDDY